MHILIAIALIVAAYYLGRLTQWTQDAKRVMGTLPPAGRRRSR